MIGMLKQVFIDQDLHSHLTSTQIHRHSANVFNSSPYFFMTDSSSKLILKLMAKYWESQVEVKGIVLHPNGLPLSVPGIYRSAVVKKLKAQPCKQGLKYYFNEHGSICLMDSIEIMEISETATDILKNVRECLRPLMSAIQEVGGSRKFSQCSLKAKRASLTLQKSVKSILRNREQQGLSKSSGHKGTAFEQCLQIREPDQDSGETLTTSGHFQIQRKLCSIVKDVNTPPHTMPLAVKRFRCPVSPATERANKLERELSIVQEIVDASYSATYWKPYRENSSAIYMNFIPRTLDDHIYSSTISIYDFLSLGAQVVAGVQVLHQSGIVHRDLKPGNFLVKEQADARQLKIIDFGESALVADCFESCKESKLGATVPYSPIECFQQCQNGFNKKQIDYWSVGVILYQLLFQKIPITYSRCFSVDIIQGWKKRSEFSLCPHIFKKPGLPLIEFILNALTLCSVCIDPAQRINLQQMESIITAMKDYVNEF